jgi:deoxyribodipyrimidine photo-lyase
MPEKSNRKILEKMPKIHSRSLFIFRRDLRCFDNNGLKTALHQSNEVIPCFFLDPRQIENHPYQSKPGLQFLIEALQDLDSQLTTLGSKLHVFYAQPENLFAGLQNKINIEAIYVNRDYTPFSRQRDAALRQACMHNEIAFYSCNDLLINEPESILTANGTPYQIFSAFYKRSIQTQVDSPAALPNGAIAKIDSLPGIEILAEWQKVHHNPLNGGRQPALTILDNLSHCQEYTHLRDFPALIGTSNLSVYLKFGCCSIREAYFAVMQKYGPDHALLRQFYWRDFFCHIGWHFPQVFGHAFHQEYDKISWRNDLSEFQRWANGTTGFPIVDAGMRQLNTTGMMHNRVRMIVASFLVKDLQISWRWGERYFAQHLLDYDPCLNNGNWQWSASTGCDAQPYFRIFNPWLQQQKFDPDCVYIKHWIPELKQVSSTIIHQWFIRPVAGTYPEAMLNHTFRSQQTKILYQQARQFE